MIYMFINLTILCPLFWAKEESSTEEEEQDEEVRPHCGLLQAVTWEALRPTTGGGNA